MLCSCAWVFQYLVLQESPADTVLLLELTCIFILYNLALFIFYHKIKNKDTHEIINASNRKQVFVQYNFIIIILCLLMCVHFCCQEKMYGEDDSGSVSFTKQMCPAHTKEEL